jgi:septal ring factor EnvC (AmiA/AmiB activator)
MEENMKKLEDKLEDERKARKKLEDELKKTRLELEDERKARKKLGDDLAETRLDLGTITVGEAASKILNERHPEAVRQHSSKVGEN